MQYCLILQRVVFKVGRSYPARSYPVAFKYLQYKYVQYNKKCMQPIVIKAGSCQIIKLRPDLILSLKTVSHVNELKTGDSVSKGIISKIKTLRYICCNRCVVYQVYLYPRHICLPHCSDIDVPIIDNKAEIAAPTAIDVEL